MSKTSKALDLNLDTLISDMRQGAKDFCDARAVVNLNCYDYQSAADELERLRDERDEALRERDEARKERDAAESDGS